MAEVEFEFKPGDGATQSDLINRKIAEVAARQTNTIRRFGRLRDTHEDRAVAGIAATNKWAELAELVIVLSYDVARLKVDLKKAEAGNQQELQEHLRKKLTQLGEDLEKAAREEPLARAAVSELLRPPPKGEDGDPADTMRRAPGVD